MLNFFDFDSEDDAGEAVMWWYEEQEKFMVKMEVELFSTRREGGRNYREGSLGSACLPCSAPFLYPLFFLLYDSKGAARFPTH